MGILKIKGKKILLIILDGASDRPCKRLKGKTPLEAAFTPNLDFLAEYGKTGLLFPIKGIAPESDEAMIALLGYNVFKSYTGRGILEALGSGIKIKKNALYLRCNFIKIRGNKILNIEYIPKRRELKKIEDIVNKIKLGCKFEFKSTIGHRAVLIFYDNLDDHISGTHPGYKIIKNKVTEALPTRDKIKKCFALKNSELAKKTAEIINDFTKKTIAKLKKFNLAILTRGASKRLPRLKKMKDWCLISDMPVEIAIGKICKMKIIKKPKDFSKLARIISKVLEKKNVYLQIKGPDSAAHKGKVIEKKEIIEKIDREFFFPLLQSIDLTKTIICVTSDHATPCSLKSHSSDPVALTVYGKGRDRTHYFSEKSCAKGWFGKIEGKKLLKKLLR